MEKTELVVELRKTRGKNACRLLRREGRLPCELYGAGEKNLSLEVRLQDFQKLVRQHTGENILVDLKIGDDDKIVTKTVLLKEIQHDPVEGHIMHVDFHQVSLKEKVEVEVPIKVVGEAPGVTEGGVLEHHLKEIKMKCLPTEIPEDFPVDISGLEIGDSIRVNDLKAGKGMEILETADDVVLGIRPPTELKEEVPSAPAETEPEVIGEKEREERREGTGKAKEERRKEKEKAKETGEKKEKKEGKKEEKK